MSLFSFNKKPASKDNKTNQASPAVPTTNGKNTKTAPAAPVANQPLEFNLTDAIAPGEVEVDFSALK